MWKTLSLQNRLTALLVGMMVGAFAIALIGLLIFSSTNLIEERNPAEDVARYFASAVVREMQTRPDARPVLQSLLTNLGDVSGGNMVVVRPGDNSRISAPPHPSSTPAWFVKLLETDDEPLELSLGTPTDTLGKLVVFPDSSPAIREKWVDFLAILIGTLVLSVLAFAMTHITVGATLAPLNEIRTGLARLKAGEFGQPVACSGPPDILRSCTDVNELAATLEGLSQNNRHLMRRLVKLQDDERAEIARDLHDELGPLLFALRANTSAYRSQAGTSAASVSFGRTMEGIIEAIQEINRRILERLRPTHLRDEGLVSAIKGLVQGAAARIGAPQVDFQLDGRIDDADEVVGRTIYRLVQEGLTNVFRHARAKHVGVSVALDETQRRVRIEISDDGVGIAPDQSMGRGLAGMTERVEALGGEFRIEGHADGTTVNCVIPWQPS